MKLAGSLVDVVDIYSELFVYVDCKNIPQICDIKLKFEKKSIKSPLTLDPVTIDRQMYIHDGQSAMIDCYRLEKVVYRFYTEY